ncbi:MAG: stage II sporulation protein M [Planctomycetes bacterium]|nr:stage II sporulation protein M [Planctomycetota bacterium]
MRSLDFRREREPAWVELEKLLTKTRRSGIRSLSAAEISRLPVLYRACVSSLGVARAISLDQALVTYLENLAQRAYFVVYGTKRPILEVTWEFVAHQVPRAVREAWLALAISMLMLATGSAIGFAMVRSDPARFHDFVGEELAGDRGPHADRETLHDSLYSGETHGHGDLAAFSAFLFQNNSSVGILAFALGVLFGLPAGLLVFNNGLMLGAFAAIYHEKSLAIDLWGWLLPHGVTELLAIVLCGAAGLTVGGAIVFPSSGSRLESLRRAGMRAGTIVIGTLPMFLVAGIIEGIFRQVVHDLTMRYSLALVTAVFWTWYFGWAGRSRR